MKEIVLPATGGVRSALIDIEFNAACLVAAGGGVLKFICPADNPDRFKQIKNHLKLMLGEERIKLLIQGEDFVPDSRGARILEAYYPETLGDKDFGKKRNDIFIVMV